MSARQPPAGVVKVPLQLRGVLADLRHSRNRAALLNMPARLNRSEMVLRREALAEMAADAARAVDLCDRALHS